MDGRQFDGDDLAASMRHRTELHGDALVEVPVWARTTFAGMLVRNWVGTPGTSLIRRAVLESVGELDPATAPADDWDLNVRLARRGDFVFVDRVVLNWRRRPDAQANTSKRWRYVYLAVRRRSILSSENTPEQRHAAIALLRRDCRSSRRSAANDLSRRRLRSAAATAYYAVLVHASFWRVRFFGR
jgi:hypothetical protein